MAQLTKQLETLRQKDAKALNQELAELRVTLQKTRVDAAFGRLPKLSQINSLRKQVARIQTILKEKETSHV